MSAERLRWCLDQLGWSQGELRRRLGIRQDTVDGMVHGKRFIPNRVAIWIDTLASLVGAMKPSVGDAAPMTAERLSWCLDQLGWSRLELSRRLSVSEGTAANMVNGKRHIPNRVAIWIETLVSVTVALPGPYLWQPGAKIGSDRHSAGVAQLESGWSDPAAKTAIPRAKSAEQPRA
jgi:plasmid maintenance system antidote protein VapI